MCEQNANLVDMVLIFSCPRMNLTKIIDVFGFVWQVVRFSPLDFSSVLGRERADKLFGRK